MNNFIYIYYDKLYINLTNQCPCNCTFCIRHFCDGVGSAETLWLEKEPTVDEVISELANYDFEEYNEVIFCGYGEPFCRLNEMLEICSFLHKTQKVKISIDTNGLGELINDKPVVHMLDGSVDCVSISLNAADKHSYYKLCNPVFGSKSYDYMLKFINDCKEIVPEVKLTVVDVISQDEIEKCKKIADELGLPFGVRSSRYKK